jgi:hypothetical protein
VNSQKLTAHLQCDRYGAFQLTRAVRPAPGLGIVPREGFRFDTFRDKHVRVPVLAAAVSREKLFDVFVDLAALAGPVVDVVLESSHECKTGHRDHYRDEIDLPVLLSHLCDFEDLLLDDGCSGVAVISNTEPFEVQFDEHKLLVLYAHDLEPAEAILRQHGLPRDDRLKLINEGKHLHSTDPRHLEAFGQLCCRLGVGEPAERVNW